MWGRKICSGSEGVFCRYNPVTYTVYGTIAVEIVLSGINLMIDDKPRKQRLFIKSFSPNISQTKSWPLYILIQLMTPDLQYSIQYISQVNTIYFSSQSPVNNQIYRFEQMGEENVCFSLHYIRVSTEHRVQPSMMEQLTCKAQFSTKTCTTTIESHRWIWVVTAPIQLVDSLQSCCVSIVSQPQEGVWWGIQCICTYKKSVKVSLCN